MDSELKKAVLILCIFLAFLGFGQREATADRILSSESDFVTRADRILDETQNNNTASALTVRTERVDPLHDLKKYRGGYNITNKHYWSSTIFTGKFGYIIAALWIISGLLYAIVLLAVAICCKKRRNLEHKRFSRIRTSYCHCSFVFGILLTLLAIVASGVALGGSTRFNLRAKTVKNIIVDAANNASGTIYSVTDAVKEMQVYPQIYGRLDGSGGLNSTLHRLDGEADNIRRKADKSMRWLNKGLRILNVVTIVTVSVNLMLIIALLASGPFLRFRKLFQVLIILCWVLTFLFWLYFGLYYFLNKFAGDTCAALDEFRQDPRNSTLSSVLPCNDQASAKAALKDVGSGIYNIINQANSIIPSLSSASVPGIEFLCNPFTGPPEYNYQPGNCSNNTIPVGDIPQVLKAYACLNETCDNGEFISLSDYNKVAVYSSSIQDILDAYPGMESLVDCQLVKDAFSKILFDECMPLKKYVHMTWAGFVTLSTIMVVLLLLWTVKAHRDSKHHFSDGSVKPHSTPKEPSEIDVSEMGPKPSEFTLEP